MPWNSNAEGCAASKRRIHGETPAEALGDDVEDDVQAEPGAAMIAPCGEEWVKSADPDVLGHADAVVRDRNLDVIAADRPCANRQGSGPTVRIRVDHHIEKQVGQHL